MRYSSLQGVLWAGLILVLLGCAAGISSQARSQVTYVEPFGELQQNPERHLGEIVLLGGKIIATQVQAGTTELTVLQQELDRSDRPRETDQSAGRFIVRASQFLDPALYPEGTAITVVGQVAESEERLIGSMPYQYPVVTPIEIKKWPKEQDQSPRFHFGIGVGTRF